MPDLIVSSSIDTFMASSSQAQMRAALSLGSLSTQTANISDYLTTASAVSTYLPLSSSGNFLPFASGSNYLTVSAAGSIYLTIAGAASTYLPLTSGVNFLTTTAAASNYLTITGASSSYLTNNAAITGYQPLDSDLTSIAALSTTAFGRSGLTFADASDARSHFGFQNNVIIDSSSGRTLSISDSNKYIKFTNTGNIIVTVPIQSSVPWPSGVEILFRRSALAGSISVIGPGVTFDGSSTSVPTSSNFALKNISLNSWDII